MSEQYKAWRMQVENFLATLSPHWLPLLNTITKQETGIHSQNLHAINIYGFHVRDLGTISSNLWIVLCQALTEVYLPQLEALGGGEDRNGFEVWRRLHFYHDHATPKLRARGLRAL